MSNGWKNIKVRQVATGREGTIVKDAIGFLHRGLHIVDTTGASAYVQLNADGPDTGETGWQWNTNGHDESLPANWIDLGDFLADHIDN